MKRFLLVIVVLMVMLSLQVSAQFNAAFNPYKGAQGQMYFVDTCKATATTTSEIFKLNTFHPLSTVPLSIAYKLVSAENRVVTIRVQGTMDGINFLQVDTLVAKDTVNNTWTHVASDLNQRNFPWYRYQVVGSDSNHATGTVVHLWHWFQPK